MHHCIQVEDIVAGAGANDTEVINEVLTTLNNLTNVEGDDGQSAGNIRATTDALKDISNTRASTAYADVTLTEVQVHVVALNCLPRAS